jgi:hypothetical protein
MLEAPTLTDLVTPIRLALRSTSSRVRAHIGAGVGEKAHAGDEHDSPLLGADVVHLADVAS